MNRIRKTISKPVKKYRKVRGLMPARFPKQLLDQKLALFLCRLFVACRGTVAEGHRAGQGVGELVECPGDLPPAAGPSAGRMGHAIEGFPGLSFCRG